MPSLVGTAHRVYVAHLDLSGKTHAVNFGDLTRAMQPSTTFNDGGYTCVLPGLISGAAQVDCFQDYAADVLDDEISTGQIGSQYALSVVPSVGTAAVGDVAWFSRGVLAALNPLDGAKGDMAKAMLNIAYDTAMIRGRLGHAATAVTTSASDSAIALAGPTATQSLYSALHVVAYSGFTSCTISIESDDNAGFSSATTRLTHTAATGVTNEFKSVVGGWSSETHHRVRTTASGSGSITYAVVFGVL